WPFTLVFSAEYLLRLWLSNKPLRYATSFFGIVDLISCLPQFLAIVFAPAQGFAVIRLLRLLRMFRVLKMVNHLQGARVILHGLAQARAKITVFFFTVLIFSVLAGTLLYFIEGSQPGTSFTSIPMSIYYAIVSITTVGFGDITPQTDLGRFLTMVLILSGYAVIAVPTGIVAADLSRAEIAATPRPSPQSRPPPSTRISCSACTETEHLAHSQYCHRCGHPLSAPE
ncbi:MAG: ion transporter, partial [Polyangiaceae bacterium]|nr:ion transporter [Polyangiaceae bacterium]